MSLGLAIAQVLVASSVAFLSTPPDRNGDSHPLFGVLAQKAGNELVGDDIPYAHDATGVAYGDLDGDGDLDAVTTTGTTTGTLGVLFNDGDGLLSRPIEYQTPAEATSPVLADFDGDGDLDCAVAIASDDSVWIFMNDGAGTFGVGEPMPAGDEPRSLVADDLDGDGLADLAVLNTTSADITILLNRGNAIFDLSATIPVPDLTPRGDPNPNFPIPGPFFDAGDIDGDGDLDLAIPATRTVRLLINDGEGGFVLAPDDLGSVQPLVYALEFADLDGDGDPDLAGTVFCRCSRMAVWINEGGELGEPVVYASGFNGILYANTSIALGDIDQDGDLDAVLGNQFHQDQFLHRNNGDGTFAPVEEHRIARGPWLVDLVDMNADELVDFAGVLGYFTTDSLIVTKLNNGIGGFFTSEGLEPKIKQRISYNTLAAGDLDADHDQDIVLSVLSTNRPNQVRVMVNDGSGQYAEAYEFSIGPQQVAMAGGLALAGLDGDNALDLAISVSDRTGELAGSVAIAHGIGDGTFGDPVHYPLDDTSPWGIATADLDADGDQDLLTGVVEIFDRDDDLFDRALHVRLNDGSGGFADSYDVLLVETRSALSLIAVDAADFDGDGDTDAIVTTGPRLDPGWAFVLVNDGAGNLSLDQTIDLTAAPFGVAIGDFDADGYPDAAVTHNNNIDDNPYLTILRNDGTGHLAIAQTFADTNLLLTDAVAVEDVNDDGAPDIICSADAGGVVIHLNDGAGTFTGAAWYHAHGRTDGLALFDLDGDGDKDLIGASSSGRDDLFFVLYNIGRSCRADLSGDGELSPEDFFLYLELFAQGDDRADITGDGTLDSDDFFGFLDLYAQGCEG